MMMRFLWRLLYPLLLYMVFSSVFTLFFGGELLAATAAGALVSIPVLLFFYSRDQKTRGSSLRSEFTWSIEYLYAAIAGFGMCLAVNYVIVISQIQKLFTGYHQVSVQIYTPPLWLQVAAVGWIIPAAEELVFRGMFFRRLRDRLDFQTAALWSSLFFGLYHGNVVQGIYAFVLSLSMAYLYEKSRHLLVPYAFHAAVNLTSLAATHTGLLEYTGEGAVTIAAAVFSICLAWGGFRLFSKNYSSKGEPL